MAWVLLLGRIIFGGFFIFNGINHFMSLGMMSGYAASKKVPAPGVAVAGSGVMLLAGGLSVLLGVWPVIGLVLLILFLVPVAFAMHNFWAVEDPMQRQAEQVNFMKNLALVGAALALMYGASGWPLSIT